MIGRNDRFSPHSRLRGPSVSTFPVTLRAVQRLATTASSPISTQEDVAQPRLKATNKHSLSGGGSGGVGGYNGVERWDRGVVVVGGGAAGIVVAVVAGCYRCYSSYCWCAAR